MGSWWMILPASFFRLLQNFHIALIEPRTTLCLRRWLDAKTRKREGLKRGDSNVEVERGGVIHASYLTVDKHSWPLVHRAASIANDIHQQTFSSSSSSTPPLPPLLLVHSLSPRAITLSLLSLRDTPCRFPQIPSVQSHRPQSSNRTEYINGRWANG